MLLGNWCVAPEYQETPNVFCVQQVVHNSYFVTFSPAASSQFSIATVEEQPGCWFTVVACCFHLFPFHLYS